MKFSALTLLIALSGTTLRAMAVPGDEGAAVMPPSISSELAVPDTVERHNLADLLHLEQRDIGDEHSIREVIDPQNCDDCMEKYRFCNKYGHAQGIDKCRISCVHHICIKWGNVCNGCPNDVFKDCATFME